MPHLILPRLYLIRHGKPAAAWGGDNDDPGLDAAGKLQAQAVRDMLLTLPEEHRPHRVVSSPLARCRETAEPTAQALGVEIEIDPAVGEIPTPAGLAPEARGEWLREVFQGRWADIRGDLDYEAWRLSVAQSLASRAGAAVFSHFVAINAVLSHLAGDDRVVHFRPDHTSVTILETDGARLDIVEKGREAATGVL